MKIKYRNNISESIQLDLYRKSIDKRTKWKKTITELILTIIILTICYYIMVSNNIDMMLSLSFSMLVSYLMYIIIDFFINKISIVQTKNKYKDDMEFMINEETTIDIDDYYFKVIKGNITSEYKTEEIEIILINNKNIYLCLENSEYIYIPIDSFNDEDHLEVFLDMLGFIE